MSAMSRTKGKRAEREVINVMQPRVDHVYESLRRDYAWFVEETPLLQRNTLQSDRGGVDIAGLHWLALEVKHHAKVAGKMNAWWKQCQEQKKKGQLAVLIYKGNNTPWRARFDVAVTVQSRTVPMTADVSMVDWLNYLETRLWDEALTAAWRLVPDIEKARYYRPEKEV